MTTTGLAYPIIFMGCITTLGGLFAGLMLLFEEAAKTARVPLRDDGRYQAALA